MTTETIIENRQLKFKLFGKWKELQQILGKGKASACVKALLQRDNVPLFFHLDAEQLKDADKKLDKDAVYLWLATQGKATGVCQVCSRKLTDSKSIAIGIGPVCAARIENSNLGSTLDDLNELAAQDQFKMKDLSK